MKYKFIKNDIGLCFPNIYEDDIDWFKKQKDPLDSNQRKMVESIYNKIINNDNIDKQIILTKELLNYLIKTKKVTKVTKNVLNETCKLLTNEKKLMNCSNKKNNTNTKDVNIFNKFFKRWYLWI